MGTTIDLAPNKAVLVGTDKIPIADGTGDPKHYTINQIRDHSVDDAIVNGEVDKAPSQNAVFDALALKASSVHTHTASDVTDFSTAADARITAQKGLANGIATLGADTKIPSAQLPAVAITDTFVVVSQVAQTALDAETGDVAVRTDENKSYILLGSDPSNFADWQELLTPTDSVLSVNGFNGAVTLTTTDITEGTNLYFTAAAAKAATVADAIADSVTDVAPSQNAVYDALALKQPLDTQLTDVAALAYAGNSLKVVRVNVGETAFELATVSGGASAIDDLSDAKADATNLFLGSTSGNGLTSGTNNVAAGIGAADALTTGLNNIAIGFNALGAVTTGQSNTAVGSAALATITTASNNTAVGINTLTATTSGQLNTAVGANCLDANTSGGSNAAVGQGALGSNTTASTNTAVGKDCLANVTTSGNNTAVGKDALLSSSAADNVAVGASAADANTSGTRNTAIGTDSLGANTTSSDSTAVGYRALLVNTAAEVTGIGSGALDANTSGLNGTAVGYNALGANTTGNYNTSVGHTALLVNTTGQRNVAMGAGSLIANTTGDFNTAIGQASLATNTTSANNTAVGYQALLLNTAANNVAVGYTAGDIITSGADNTFLGSGADSNSATGTGRIAIGKDTLVTADNTWVMGTIGKKQAINEGSNAAMGVATLSGGTVTVNNTLVTANSRIFLTCQSLGTVAVPSGYGVSARSAGNSFTILASAPTDTSVIAWEIKEPN